MLTPARAPRSSRLSAARHEAARTYGEALTDVWFAIYGANLNLDANGNVETVIDAEFVHQTYLTLCAANGVRSPAVIVGAH